MLKGKLEGERSPASVWGCYLHSESASANLVMFTVLQFVIKLAIEAMSLYFPQQEM